MLFAWLRVRAEAITQHAHSTLVHEPENIPAFIGFAFTAIADIYTKWSKIDERPHHRFVTPGDGEWNRPTFTRLIKMVSWAHLSQPRKRHLDRFSRFRRAHDRTCRTDRHTDR